MLAYHLTRIRRIPALRSGVLDDVLALDRTIRSYINVLTESHKMERIRTQEFYDAVHSKLPKGYRMRYQDWHQRKYNDDTHVLERTLPNGETLILWLGEEAVRLREEAEQLANEEAQLALAQDALSKLKVSKSLTARVEEEEQVTVMYGRAQNARPSPRVETAPATSKPSSKRDKRLCWDCEDSHKLEQCPKFKAMAVEVRRKYLMDNERCFRCLYEGHRLTECRGTNNCASCPRKHHSLLHGEPRLKPVRGNAVALEESSWDQDSDVESDYETEDQAASFVAVGEGLAGLRVVPVVVQNPESGASVKVTAL